MPHCAVSKCFNNSSNSPGLSFFSFPKVNQSEWLHRCARKDKINIKTARVCGKHFLDDDLDESYKIQRSVMPTNVKLKPKLKTGAVPSFNLPSSTFRQVASLTTYDDTVLNWNFIWCSFIIGQTFSHFLDAHKSQFTNLYLELGHGVCTNIIFRLYHNFIFCELYDASCQLLHSSGHWYFLHEWIAKSLL